jgi:hypothetical protein
MGSSAEGDRYVLGRGVSESIRSVWFDLFMSNLDREKNHPMTEW